MKKIIALIMAVIMMLSLSACAEGIEIGMSSLTLVENNEVVMQMPDPGVRIAFADNGEAMGLRAALVANGQTALEAVITLGAEKLMASATGISDIYAVNVAQVLAIVTPYLENITTMLPAGMELTEADTAIVTELTTVAQNAVANGTYYSEDGTTMGVKFGAEDVRTLWGLVLELAGNHPEVLEMLEIPAEALPELQMPADFNIEADASLSYTDAGISGALVIDLSQGTDAAAVELSVSTDMVSALNLGFALRQDDIVVTGAELVISFAENDGAWLISNDAVTVDVLTMSDEQLEKLTTEAQGLLSMFGLA